MLLLLLAAHLASFHSITARIPLIPEYPEHIGSRCIAAFDCDPGGARFCVPLSAVRDCFVDCPNGADEECPRNTVLCDSKLRRGCGKCVKAEELEMQCSDHRWRNICLEEKHFKCIDTENCILPQWVGDGVDDCADGSDEDLCALGLTGCNETETAPGITSPFDIGSPVQSERMQKSPASRPTGDIALVTATFYGDEPAEGCATGEFRCITSFECISVAHVLDGIEQCSDGSDERYCEEMVGSEMCQKPELCSFNIDTSSFTCGCPLGHRRASSGLCIPFLAPVFSGDCADLQKRYHSIGSGQYTLSDWSCSQPKLCNFTAHCEMEIFGGGWTVIMQRFDTTLAFDKDILEYENGFELDQSNFWIGLERMYRLTNRPQCPNELLLRMLTATTGETILVRYSHFVVCERLLDYRLNIGAIVFGSGLNTVNELAEGQMCPFLTNSEKECPDGGGWWRKRCQQRGVLTASNKAQGTYPGLTWNGKRLSAVQMLIRPRGYVSPSHKSSS